LLTRLGRVYSVGMSDYTRDEVIRIVGYGRKIRRANLRGIDPSRADLSFTNLGGANLRGAYLNGATLEGANLTGADLTMPACPGPSWPAQAEQE